MCSIKKVFLEILQNSQENTCARISLSIKLLNKRLWHTYVKYGGVVGQILQNVFEELQAGNGIEGIFAFLDKNLVIAIAIAERFRDWVYSYCF